LEAERTLVSLKWEVHCSLAEHFGGVKGEGGKADFWKMKQNASVRGWKGVLGPLTTLALGPQKGPSPYTYKAEGKWGLQ